MKDLILLTVKQFLERHLKEGASILLGLSGGPDSLSLLHLLVQCRRFFPLELHAAHIDHGWRPESREEALILEKKSKELEVPFHLHTLDPPKKKSNLEDSARRERLAFFSKIYREEGFQALLLAHQADDQAETVLKRIFEGGGLFAVAGMRPVSELEGMEIWRPLLKIPKAELLAWLQERELQPFEDSTNSDPRFLRARLRQNILPDLEIAYGKKIASNLGRLGDLAGELKEYFIKKAARFSEAVTRDPDVLTIDFSTYYPLESLEVRFFLKELLEKEGCLLSHQELSTLAELLLAKTPRRKVKQQLIVDRGVVSFVKKIP